VISGPFEATTVVAVRHRDQVAVAGDGQVSIGNTIVKAGAKKVRKLYHDRILAGFAGTAADAFTLFSRFESRLDEHLGQPIAYARMNGIVPPWTEEAQQQQPKPADKPKP